MRTAMTFGLAFAKSNHDKSGWLTQTVSLIADWANGPARRELPLLDRRAATES